MDAIKTFHFFPLPAQMNFNAFNMLNKREKSELNRIYQHSQLPREITEIAQRNDASDKAKKLRNFFLLPSHNRNYD